MLTMAVIRYVKSKQIQDGCPVVCRAYILVIKSVLSSVSSVNSYENLVHLLFD